MSKVMMLDAIEHDQSPNMARGEPVGVTYPYLAWEQRAPLQAAYNAALRDTLETMFDHGRPML
jgi:hypothetical protein